MPPKLNRKKTGAVSLKYKPSDDDDDIDDNSSSTNDEVSNPDPDAAAVASHRKASFTNFSPTFPGELSGKDAVLRTKQPGIQRPSISMPNLTSFTDGKQGCGSPPGMRKGGSFRHSIDGSCSEPASPKATGLRRTASALEAMSPGEPGRSRSGPNLQRGSLVLDDQGGALERTISLQQRRSSGRRTSFNLEAETEAKKAQAQAHGILARSKSGTWLGRKKQAVPAVPETTSASRTASALSAMLRRRVMFCPATKNQQYQVRPYAEVYGQHPSFFNFTREGQMQLTDKGIADEMKRQELAEKGQR